MRPLAVLRKCRPGRACRQRLRARWCLGWRSAAWLPPALACPVVHGLALGCLAAGQGAWPRAALRPAHEAKVQAVVRSTFAEAVEAFGCLAARRWRDDAGAWTVVAPWDFLRRARHGGWTPERLARCARLALTSAGATGPREHHKLRSGGCCASPLHAPWAQRCAFL